MTDAQLQKIVGQLKDHEKRISALENIEPINSSKNEPAQQKQKLSRSKGDDLFPPIQKLLNDGFFTEGRTDVEVCSTLTLKLLTKKTPLRASVVNVLRAMVKKGLLTRDQVQKDKRFVLVYKQSS